MSSWHGARRADVVILTAIRLEFDAVLNVDAGAAPGSRWDVIEGPSGLPVAFRAFVVERGRPLRVAVAVAPDMGATAATNTLLPLVETLKPRCIAMCGVCAGRRGKINLGDVVAAERLFSHDTGKRLSDEVLQDLTTYKLRDNWKAALDGMATKVVAQFRGASWFDARPITSAWREHRALKALCDGDREPWRAVAPAIDAPTWASIVASLREHKLVAGSGRDVTDEGRRVIDELLFAHMGALPDLSPAGTFQPFRLHVAPLASGSQVIEDENIWAFISHAMRKTLALEMEGAALGELAHRQRQHRLDAIVMKGVMDFADHGRDDHFKEFAARAAAECLLWFLRERVPTEMMAGFDDLLTSGTLSAPRGLSPSSLLNARHAIAPWRDSGRSAILADLDAWADEPSRAVAVRLLHAGGGIGKTRLAIEWVRRRRERHDAAGFLVPDPDRRWLERLCGLGLPVLVVIDYAESRADLVAVLERVAAFAVATGPRRRVRVLLLARGDGDWWTALPRASAAIGALISDGLSIELSPLAETAADRDAVFLEAAHTFAQILERPIVLLPPTSFEDPRFERVLYLHMAALAAVEGVAFDAGTLMDVILDHEERFWVAEARALHALAVAVPLARQLIAAATLRGGLATEHEAREMCARLTGRARTGDDDALVALLHHVYERDNDAAYLAALEPDLLGEGMVLRVISPPKGSGAPAGYAWIEQVVAGGDVHRAITAAFTVLGRASVTDTAKARPWIMGLLRADLPTRAVLALRAAKIIGQRTAFSPLGDLLAAALEQQGIPTIALDLAREEIPYPTVSLQRVAVWESRTLLEQVPAGEEDTAVMVDRAQRLSRYGLRLADVGQRETALAVAQEAATLSRKLADRNPAAFEPEFALSLNNLGKALREMGQREAALAATERAAGLYRRLAARNPDTFLSYLATSLNNLGNQLSEVGQREAALAAMQEATDLYCRLAERSPDVFEPDLAGNWNNLGSMLIAVGQREAALEATQEAVALYRRLAERNPDAFEPDLARSLHNLGTKLSAVGQREAALVATQEAVDRRRVLAKRNPDALEPNLAMSLNNLGIMLNAMGQRDAALAVSREAVNLQRELVARNPEAFEPDLAGSLNNLGGVLSAVGQREVALAATQEATALYRRLAARNPETFEPDLAMSLNNLGTRRSEVGHREAALVATQEATELYRRLAERNPEAFEPDLASSLNNLGGSLSEVGQWEAALRATLNAADLHRRLATRNPDAFEPDLAMSLSNLGGKLIEAGQREPALKTTLEAVALYRKLAARNPEAFDSALASSLSNLGTMLSEVGQREAALAATQEAVNLHRRLATRNPAAFEPDLATSLNNLGGKLSELGQREAALAMTQEAVDLRRILAERNPDAFEPGLATSLNNLGVMWSQVGQRELALVAMQEAVKLCRRLAERNLEAFEPDLARSLNNLGTSLSEVGQRESALAAAQESAELYRRLVTRNAEAFEPDLVKSLHSLSVKLCDLEQYAVVLPLMTEAIDLIWPFFVRMPDAYVTLTNGVLTMLWNIYEALDREPSSVLIERDARFAEISATRPPS